MPPISASVDISPILGDMWSLALYGEDLLFLPTQSGTLFAMVADRSVPRRPSGANAPTANAAVAVTDERSIVLIGSGGDSRMVAWSDLENTDGVDAGSSPTSPAARRWRPRAGRSPSSARRPGC